MTSSDPLQGKTEAPTVAHQELVRIRKCCKHLELAEMETKPPQRICMNCGAEEHGWYSGYQVLATIEDHLSSAPYKEQRKVFLHTSREQKYQAFRKPGRPYQVGQSHPNFGSGRKTYEELTAV